MPLVAIRKADEEEIGTRNHSIAILYGLTVEKEVRKTPELGQVQFGLKCYRNAVVLRLRLLETGLSGAYNASNLICAAILARQLVETAAHFIDTGIELEKQISKTPPDLQRIRDKVLKGLFGSKLDWLSTGLNPEQVLNCIDATDMQLCKLLPEVAKVEQKPIRRNYDFLSELLHPNSPAFLFHIDFDTAVDPGGANFEPEGSDRLRNSVSNYILGALIILNVFLYYERKFSNLLEKVGTA